MKTRLTLAAFLAVLSLSASAAEPTTGPYIMLGGASFKVDDRDVPLQKDFQYKVVFEAADYPGELSDVNRELDLVARFINMHGKNGVPLDNMDIAVVFHMKGLLSAMNDEAYEKMNGIKNPSLPLLRELAAAGVKFYACGQSLGFRGVDKSVLAEPVKEGLSAMTMIVTLQQQGYAFLP